MIQLVYYDAHDVTFDDIGLAPQLLEALRSQAKIDGAGPLNSLSDMWLVGTKGFKIQLCIDKRVYNKRNNVAVGNFVNTLKKSSGKANIEVLSRGIVDEDEHKRSMHKKTLIPPSLYSKEQRT